MRTSSISQSLLALACLSVSSVASAEPRDGMALNRFDPAFAGDDLFGVQSAFVQGERTVHAGLIMDYAHNPLMLRKESNDVAVGPVIGHQAFVHVNATMALANRVAFNVDVPLAAYQAGGAPQSAGQSFDSPAPTQFGDLRLAGRLRLLGVQDGPLQLSIGGQAWIPTGAENSFVSDEKVRGQPQLVVGGKLERFFWSTSLGVEFRPSRNYAGVAQGRTFRWGAAMGYRMGAEKSLQVGLESYGGVMIEDVNPFNTTAEVLAGVRYRFARSFVAGVAAGPGLTSGIGTPDFRGAFSVAFSPAPARNESKPAPPRDRDHDRIFDESDACPDEPGKPNADLDKHGCPMSRADLDHDGIFDSQDACPEVPGVSSVEPLQHGCPADADSDGVLDGDDACPREMGMKTSDAKTNGCPADQDLDGIADVRDACIDIKGVATVDPKTNGCPGDKDHDSIRDDQDACPNEKGSADKDPKQHGCPKSVRVTDGEIIILQQVQFDLSKSTIRSVSDPLLDEVAGVMAEHPEILKIEVQGHTDDRGFPDENEKLSQDRAQAVVDALTGRGVNASRLIAKGYGQNKPIATNKNPEGRQKNRRVQFKIVEKK